VLCATVDESAAVSNPAAQIDFADDPFSLRIG
jgi:hypothetical protein